MKAKAEKVIRSDDFEVRRAVVAWLLGQGVERGSIKHEITLDTSSSGGRADLVVLLPRSILGIEIKSGRDTLDRCESQSQQYGMAFDAKLVVADRRHVPRDCYGLPGWIDVICYEGGALTSPYGGRPDGIRGPHNARRSRCTSAERMLRLLWAGEVEALARRHHIGSSSRERCIPLLVEHVPLKDIRAGVAHELQTRAHNRWEAAFWKRFDVVEIAFRRRGAASD